METGKLFELRRRTFDTPHFRGIEFIEVEAKSIINKVPGNYLPFNYTINPYRGCSHACVYCLEGSTPILMADGGTRPISDLEVGDRIYGTVWHKNYRRFVTTEVLDHWQTIKRAYRVTLADGTDLIASADHRFLSNRGWKHVIGTESGPLQRPHLTTNNNLIGIGKFSSPPVQDEEYRRGYLCGMIRGDANLASYSYVRIGRSNGDVHRFRLALKDLEALRRSKEYLEQVGITTKQSLFRAAVGAHSEMSAIRTSRQGHIVALRDLIQWPRSPSVTWSKGFLAGIFDAEGSCSKGILRISNTDGEIIDQISRCMAKLGFDSVVERWSRQRRTVDVVRLRGGIRENLRFFHTVDPAITRKRTLDGVALKTKGRRLKVESIEDLDIEIPMFDITTGTGDFVANGVVSHNCFARSTHTYMDMNAGRDFETKIVVKVNAGELLRKELRRKNWAGEGIAMGTATDPYQRAEGKYKLMPQIIGALTDYQNPFSVLTKGTLILRDLPLLQDAANVTEVSTAFSIGTLDEDVWRKSEPGTPHPRKRIEAVRKLNDAGIPCGVLVAPVLPEISDGKEQLKEVVSAAVDAGATSVYPILLHLRPIVRDVYMEWLAETYPDLVTSYEEMYPKSYASKDRQAALSKTVHDILETVPRKNQKTRPRRLRDAHRPRVEQARLKAEQLKLV